MRTYDRLPKESNRGWIWNRLIETLEAHDRDIARSTVVYFMGPDDIDRRIAIKKGFRDENLIGLDVVEDHVRSARTRNKALCTNVSVEEFITNFNDRLDAVYADYMGGLGKAPLRLLYTLALCSREVNNGLAVAVNLLRGRDNVNHPNLKVPRPYIDLWQKTALQESGGHRGLAWCLMAYGFIAGRVTRGVDFARAEHRQAVLDQWMWENSRFESYPSGSLMFDQCVTWHPGSLVDAACESLQFNGKAKNKVAALKAIRTRRRKRNDASKQTQG